MIGFYEKMTGETIEQQDVEEDVEGMGRIIFFRFHSFSVPASVRLGVFDHNLLEVV